MNKAVNVAFANVSLKEAYKELQKGSFEDKQLFNFLNRAFEDIKKNPTCGSKLAKKLWPKSYFKYDLTNLWKYDLPNAWRLIYTIKQDEISIISMILEWSKHKDYEQRFHYSF